MDSVVAQLLSRLRTFLLQELDFEVDVPRFNQDPPYAAQVLDLAGETDDPEFRRIAEHIRARQLQLFALGTVSQNHQAVAMPAIDDGDVTSLEHEKRVAKPL